MYRNELQEIITASQNQSLTFFVGAGVSAISGMPSWREMMEMICKKYSIMFGENNSSDEYMKISQILYYRLRENKKEFVRVISSILDVNCFDAKRNCSD